MKPAIRFWTLQFLICVLIAPASALADSTVQFCWAMGKFDSTVYFAEAENREDRQASFDALLEISGIDHHLVQCRTIQTALHRQVREVWLRNWAASELEIVNTTFLSDLDY